MGRIEKLKSVSIYENGRNKEDSDDEEANEDLSLKIVEKAVKRASGADNASRGNEGDVTINISSSSSPETKLVTNVKDSKKKRKKKEKKPNKKVESPEVTVIVPEEARKDEKQDVITIDETVNVSAKVAEKGKCDVITIDDTDETNPVEKSDNAVLRKLLRGPRYFDPPDSGWGACYNCGEEGHTSFKCTSARRKKPCFVCGSLEHNAKQCTKGHDCFICKKGGHRAKDCPDKYTSSSSDKICLRCGQSGHEMFSCRNDYPTDDLKEIQCYICKRFGHLCCVKYTGSIPKEISCFKCGQLGHTGLACSGGSNGGETTSPGPNSSCYRCGEEGHYARECSNATTKSAKRHRDLSTQTRSVRENREIYEARSAPVKCRKKKKNKYEGEFATPQSREWGVFDETSNYNNNYNVKSSKRRGWMTEDYEEDFPRSRNKPNGSWLSPSTPGASSSRSRISHNIPYENPASNSSYHHRFYASRFSNSSHDGSRRDYDW